MENQKIIAFVGMPGSGKGTCSDFLGDKYDWPIVHFGSMIYEEVQRRGLDNVKNEAAVREDMRKIEGPAVFAIHALRKAKNQDSKIVIFDGLYSWSEYKYLSQELKDNLIVIAITAPKKLRRDRVLNRKDSHRKYTLQQLIEREEKEIENIEKGGPIAYADYTINNSKDQEDLTDSLEEILRQESII